MSDNHQSETIEREQPMIRRVDAGDVFEQHAGSEVREGRPVASIAEGKEVSRVPAMGANVRQPVRRRRKQTVPPTLDVDVPQRRKKRREVVMEPAHAVPHRRGASLAGHERTVGAAEQQAMVGGPAAVVVRTPRVPQQDVGEADLPPRPRVERRRRRDVRCLLYTSDAADEL